MGLDAGSEEWNVTNTPCSWFGVTCENGGVTEIDIWRNQLTGTIPDFSALPNLQTLQLSSNQLTGAIPDFSALPNLLKLSLYRNKLTGPIPDFSALPNLQELFLINNKLTGPIPDFSALPNLQELYLENNQLTGAIPDFSALPNLQRLELDNNQLTGPIPDFSALPNLQELSLVDNQLTGPIPDFSALPNLLRLYLWDNQLTGAIPDFSALPNLQTLYLWDNQLTGAIPDFSALPNLQKLGIWNNQLTGPIPDFSPLTELKYLDIRNNPICKDTNINYSSWPIIRDQQYYNDDEVEATWQEELDGFPNCPVNPPPTPVITVLPPHGMAPLEIDLDASNSEGSITQYTWTINGQTLSGKTNSTTLTEAGENTIILTVTDPEGQTATIQQNVSVWKPGQAIIIAGPNSKDNLFQYTNEFTQRMYRLLKMRGYDDEKIHYLNMLAPDIERPLDGRPEPERQDYSLFDPTKELSEAFAKATANLTIGDQFVLYLHGHAGMDRFKLLNENISATHLRDLLATLPAGVQQIIILDTCYSGSFIDDLKGVEHRVIVTSTNDKSLTWQIANSSFADRFMQSLEQGRSLLESFQTAETMILENPDLFAGQRPWFDDDNDGQFLNDGLYAENVRVGLRRVAQAPPPEIKQVHPYITLPENEGTTTLWIKMADNENIHKVRAILVPPQYQVREYQGEDTDFSRIELPMRYNAVEDNYGVKYEGFCAKSGSWQILYQAQDTEGVWSETVQGEVQASECLSATVKMQLNQSRYTTGNPLRLDMQVNGQAQVDLYVAIVFPEGTFITITYPFKISFPNTIQIYQPNVEIAGQKIYPIMNFPLPGDIKKGQYQVYGVLVTAGTEPKTQNWIHFDNEMFEVY
jgi:Leucine-rich repeat (LRR) protein